MKRRVLLHRRPVCRTGLLLVAIGGPLGRESSAGEFEVRGSIAAESRFFVEHAAYPGQHGTNGSVSAQPEFAWTTEDAAHTVVFTPFLRVDQGDSRRSHGDIRELSYLYARGEWEFRAGIGREFWGVAESNHLVDIINQTDLVENLDTEDKLGQPMLKAALSEAWGTVEAFILPGARARTFPGKSGRLRSEPRVDTSSATWESAAEETHVDFALRYSHTVGDLDFGLAHFHGTTREPEFHLQPNGASGPFILAPHYALIDQSSVDASYAWNSWMFKLEALYRTGQQESFGAMITGFEYTSVGIMDSEWDLGWLAEYHTDGRGRATLTPFNHDLFLGTRLALNDFADTRVLAGLIADLHGEGRFFNLEASRRFGEHWTLELETRVFWSASAPNPIGFITQDDYVQLQLNRFF